MLSGAQVHQNVNDSPPPCKKSILTYQFSSSSTLEIWYPSLDSNREVVETNEKNFKSDPELVYC